MTAYDKNRKRMSAERFLLLRVDVKQAIRLARAMRHNLACKKFPVLLVELYEELKHERARLRREREKRSET